MLPGKSKKTMLPLARQAGSRCLMVSFTMLLVFVLLQGERSNICVCLIKKPVRGNFKAPAPFLFVKTGLSLNYQGSESGEP